MIKWIQLVASVLLWNYLYYIFKNNSSLEPFKLFFSAGVLSFYIGIILPRQLNNIAKATKITNNSFLKHTWYFPILYIPIRLIINYFKN